jgi:hypothetical protein
MRAPSKDTARVLINQILSTFTLQTNKISSTWLHSHATILALNLFSLDSLYVRVWIRFIDFTTSLII